MPGASTVDVSPLSPAGTTAMRFSTSIAPIALILLMAQHTLAYAAEFMCAGVPGAHYDFSEAGMAAKAVQRDRCLPSICIIGET